MTGPESASGTFLDGKASTDFYLQGKIRSGSEVCKDLLAAVQWPDQDTATFLAMSASSVKIVARAFGTHGMHGWQPYDVLQHCESLKFFLHGCHGVQEHLGMSGHKV